jgi:hypothetical protein
MERIVNASLLLSLTCLTIHAAESPLITSSFPSALSSTDATELIVRGEHLQDVTGMWASFPMIIESLGATDANTARFRIATDAPKSGIGLIRLLSPNGVSNLLPLMVDDLPSIAATGTNRTVASAQLISIPTAVDGFCEARQSDFYQLTLQSGQRLEIDLVAARSGSQLDALLRLLDPHGRELAYCDDGPDSPDPRISYLAPADGPCLIEVRDTRYDGGSRHRYRLRASSSSLAPIQFLSLKSNPTAQPPLQLETEPNDDRSKASTVALPAVVTGAFNHAGDQDYFSFAAEKGARWVIRGRTRSLGSPCDLGLELLKPDGGHLADAAVGTINEGTITNTFSEAGTYYLRVEELNRFAGPDLHYQIGFELLPPGFELKVETDRLQASPGGEAKIKVSALRRGYDGSIELTWSPALPDFAPHTIAEKEGSSEWTIAWPKSLRPGQWFNVRLRGQAKIGEATFITEASTLPALEKLFPVLLYQPMEFDGLMTLAVTQP